KIWNVHISEVEKYDKALADSWRGNMNGILIFVGLFFRHFNGLRYLKLQDPAA
ncbi:hypothetical protein B0H13DRAFT_1588188, partial [Mycena leptocephala]